jgi:hypothetical protein
MSNLAHGDFEFDFWDTARKVGDQEWELDGHDFTKQQAIDKAARLKDLAPKEIYRAVHVTGVIRFTEEAS